MFPTPPSLESCQAFSPEGRVLHSVSSGQISLNTANELDSGVVCKRETDKLELNSGFSLSDHPHYSVATSVHNAPAVLQTNNKVFVHPLSEIYQPLSNLSQLPLSHPYVPSWMVSRINILTIFLFYFKYE